ncbi:hypothetical protein CTM63_11950 [Prevotella intermedia]|uniref:hypothetical protein n=1 Tax=Prevotella intermedia TaxID=28131 RepID=UPI000C1C8107|nr:hypothetical protein [Prevotella intermedia]ATV29882.1 hypothetical protein CTM63_11950 [Prevotella intermedia]
MLMNTQKHIDEYAEVCSVGWRYGRQNAFICPEYTLYTSHEQGNSSVGDGALRFNTRGAQRKRVFNALSMRKEAYTNRMGYGQK